MSRKQHIQPWDTIIYKGLPGQVTKINYAVMQALIVIAGKSKWVALRNLRKKKKPDE
jgi:hypothetical protein